MDNKVLLIKCITLLYREAQLENNDGGAKELVKQVVSSIKVNGDISGADSILSGLQKLVETLLNSTEGLSYPDLMQHIKMVTQYDTNLFESLQDALAYPMSPDETAKANLYIRLELGRYLRTKKAIEHLDKLVYNLKFKRDTLGNVDDHITSTLEKVSGELYHGNADIPGIIGEVDLDDLDSVESELNLIKAEADGSRILVGPWQAFNRMTRGGIRLGQLTLVGGLGHNNKTGFCLSLFISACIFNDPKTILKDPNKKPMNILFTFEDDIKLALSNIYTLLKGNLENIQVSDEDKKNLDTAEAAKYIHSRLKVNGYHVKIIRINPDEITYRDIQNKLSLYMAQGYEIHLCLIDYLSLVSKRGLSNIRLDTDLQELFRRTKNFACGNHDIALLVPHQLSPDAMELKRQGNKMLALQVANGSYYADARGLNREPELEILIDKVVDNGKAYQAVARGKHRGQNDTPEKDKFFILPFEQVGGLRWDIHGADTSLTKFGATRNEEGEEEAPFYL